ncbi:MAG: RtcB family protein [Chitinispirillaceae bacterium]
MKKRDIAKSDLPSECHNSGLKAAVRLKTNTDLSKKEIINLLSEVAANPACYKNEPHLKTLAEELICLSDKPEKKTELRSAPYKVWGDNHDREPLEQLRRACSLPVALRGALMPDAHVGYGLPIGGVLAADNAVIPYAVGVDIACRMRLTVVDLPVNYLDRRTDKLKSALEKNTLFGVGVSFRDRKQHEVMDRNWKVSPVTAKAKDTAWGQLGTSGSGNHFVEWGTFTTEKQIDSLEPGTYLALLSHSGSRGSGSRVANYYSTLASKKHPELPKGLKNLAWLDLSSHEGKEYWAAMELMGAYAAANHELIHNSIVRHLKATVLLGLENHHNFAWKETHGNRQVVVHRKGATPAQEGVRGIIPGSMATPGFLVEGKGNAASLCSSSHGAGRVMSRAQAKNTYRWKDVRGLLSERRVTVLSAGLDEIPLVYKDIMEVMDAQRELVDILGRFDPRIVKMAPAGERAED